MNRIHTLRSVADEMRRDKRTVQAWYQRAKKEHGELGEIIDSTRYFNDSERDILISYAGSDRAAGATEPQITVESGNHQLLLPSPQMPENYSLEGLRTGESVQFEDPLEIAAQFLQIADQIQDAMQSDIEQREQKLTKTRQAKEAIAAKAQELKLEQRFYQERSRQIDSAQSQETQSLQNALTVLQSMGKSPVAPTAGS